MQDDVIGTSASFCAFASFSRSAGNSWVSPRICRHSTRPCSAQTLSGCWAQRWMLRAQAQIVAIDLLGFLVVALLRKQRRQGMARRMHPRPGLYVLEIVVAANALAQMLVGGFVVALVVRELAVEHLFATAKMSCAGLLKNRRSFGMRATL